MSSATDRKLDCEVWEDLLEDHLGWDLRTNERVCRGKSTSQISEVCPTVAQLTLRWWGWTLSLGEVCHFMVKLGSPPSLLASSSPHSVYWTHTVLGTKKFSWGVCWGEGGAGLEHWLPNLLKVGRWRHWSMYVNFYSKREGI